LGGSYHQYHDGSIDAEVSFPAGREPLERLIEVESTLRDVLDKNPDLWMQVGVVLRPRDMSAEEIDRYEEHEGRIVHWTFPRKAEFWAYVFAAAREIATNMIEYGYKIMAFIARVTNVKPEKEIRK
jgi:hypothetical protein